MNAFIQIEFQELIAEKRDIAIAKLIESGYEGFEETDHGLKAFINKKYFSDHLVKDISTQLNSPYTQTLVEETNWNKVWESNFDPVIVDDFVAIRAEFHEPIIGVQHELIVTPKMSFGTGHHATTHMMIQQMRQIEMINKSVLDFGTGTGVLAILAEKLGASAVTAIDNDDWSIENASENIDRNGCLRVRLSKADAPSAGEKFDVVLANINKNVILDHFSELVNILNPGAVLLISGILKEDEDVVFRKSIEYSLHIIQTSVRDNWLCLRLSC